MSDRVRFTPDMRIEEVLGMDPRIPELFRRLGLKCVPCLAQSVETLRHAALYHGTSLDQLLEELNRLKVKKK